jgi:hypothetical protein
MTGDPGGGGAERLHPRSSTLHVHIHMKGSKISHCTFGPSTLRVGPISAAFSLDRPNEKDGGIGIYVRK